MVTVPNTRCTIQYAKKVGNRIYTSGVEWDLSDKKNIEISMTEAFEHMRNNVNFYRDRDLSLDVEEEETIHEV